MNNSIQAILLKTELIAINHASLNILRNIHIGDISLSKDNWPLNYAI